MLTPAARSTLLALVLAACGAGGAEPSDGGSPNDGGSSNDAALASDARTDVDAAWSDEGPPFVVATRPSDGTVGVDPRPTIEIQFNEPIMPSSGSVAMLTLLLGPTERALTTVGWNARGDVLSVRPTSALPYGERISMEIRYFIDLAGERQVDPYVLELGVAPDPVSTHATYCVADWLGSDPSRPLLFSATTSDVQRLPNGSDAVIITLTPLAPSSTTLDVADRVGDALVVRVDNPPEASSLDGLFEHEPTTVPAAAAPDGVAVTPSQLETFATSTVRDYCGRMQSDRGPLTCVFQARTAAPSRPTAAAYAACP